MRNIVTSALGLKREHGYQRERVVRILKDAATVAMEAGHHLMFSESGERMMLGDVEVYYAPTGMLSVNGVCYPTELGLEVAIRGAML